MIESLENTSVETKKGIRKKKEKEEKKEGGSNAKDSSEIEEVSSKISFYALTNYHLLVSCLRSFNIDRDL